MRSVLIANRGEVAVRVARAAADAGVRSVAVFSEDDADAPHVRSADGAVALAGSGPAPYLSIEAMVGAARSSGCDALHPGYGFLSESAALARACAEAGIIFVGPGPDVLELLGDKVRSRALAQAAGIAVPPGTDGPADAGAVRSLLASSSGPVVIKAVAGGGGRGMRVVSLADEVDAAWSRCRSEAEAAFGSPEVYAEAYLASTRHVEVQVAADIHGAVAVLGDRDCSLQRRHQKVVEIAPAPHLSGSQRAALHDAARRLAVSSGCSSLVTFEFLVGLDDGAWWFIEANPRLQVEHTVTEEVIGVDLVRAQMALADGAPLSASIPLGEATGAGGAAIQLRVNAEEMRADGSIHPGVGVITRFDLPGGPGVRVDAAATAGTRVNPRFDPLLAKVVVRISARDAGTEPLASLCRRARRALSELRIEGVATNHAFLTALVSHPEVTGGRAHTAFVEEHLGELVAHAPRPPGPSGTVDEPGHGPDGTAVGAPLSATVVSVEVSEGATVAAGDVLVVLEAMKMEHVVTAPMAALVGAVLAAPGDAVVEGEALVRLVADEAAGDLSGAGGGAEGVTDPDRVRPDLEEVLDRHRRTRDESRPEAVERRRRTGQRTARENIDQLCDPGSFVEYGALVIAAQRRRRSVEELVERTPGDGMVTGLATVNADRFGPQRSRCIVMSYDYTVLAGTQGLQNHRKKDRMFELADRWQLPVVIFAEGGGGRPGDTDGSGVSGLDCMAFHLFGRLSGRVPLVGVTSGRCFAGNAALLGCCDVVIATRGSNIGMGGPAMVEGGGLGVYPPEEIGPMDVQVPNGVVDVAVEDEEEAVDVARRYLSYFQGPVANWEYGDPRRLRTVVPENRLRVYDVHAAVDALADTGSVLELRRHFGAGMVTALARVEGRPVGIIANNPMHLAGAIDADGADKAARFMQLCDAFGIPIVSLCDTPGIMVGPDAERTALVRHCSRLFVVGASLTVPVLTIVLRKGYGLGAQAMAGGSFKTPMFCVAWPTGEFGGMGLEGAVRLGYRRELDAVEDEGERDVLFREMVARMYQHGQALNTATYFEIDDVIDPAESRSWIVAALGAAGPVERGNRPCVDTW